MGSCEPSRSQKTKGHARNQSEKKPEVSVRGGSEGVSKSHLFVGINVITQGAYSVGENDASIYEKATNKRPRCNGTERVPVA